MVSRRACTALCLVRHLRAAPTSERCAHDRPRQNHMPVNGFSDYFFVAERRLRSRSEPGGKPCVGRLVISATPYTSTGGKLRPVVSPAGRDAYMSHTEVVFGRHPQSLHVHHCQMHGSAIFVAASAACTAARVDGGNSSSRPTARTRIRRLWK